MRSGARGMLKRICVRKSVYTRVEIGKEEDFMVWRVSVVREDLDHPAAKLETVDRG